MVVCCDLSFLPNSLTFSFIIGPIWKEWKTAWLYCYKTDIESVNEDTKFFLYDIPLLLRIECYYDVIVTKYYKKVQ